MCLSVVMGGQGDRLSRPSASTAAIPATGTATLAQRQMRRSLIARS